MEREKVLLLILAAKRKVFVWRRWNFVQNTSRHIAAQRKNRQALRQTGQMQLQYYDRSVSKPPTVLISNIPLSSYPIFFPISCYIFLCPPAQCLAVMSTIFILLISVQFSEVFQFNILLTSYPILCRTACPILRRPPVLISTFLK